MWQTLKEGTASTKQEGDAAPQVQAQAVSSEEQSSILMGHGELSSSPLQKEAMAQAFLLAASCGDYEAMKKLFRLHPSRADRLDMFREKDSTGRTALHLAAAAGHDKVINVWLEECSPSDRLATVREKDSTGRTALHLSAAAGFDTVTQLLLEGLHADRLNIVRIKDSTGCTALHLAAAAGHDKVIKLLLREFTPSDRLAIVLLVPFGIQMAIAAGLHKISQWLVMQRFHAGTLEFVREKDSTGRTAIHLAAAAGQDKAIYLLLERCSHSNMLAIIGEKDSTGRTALHLAAAAGHDMVIQLLLRECSRSDRLDIFSNKNSLGRRLELKVNAKDKQGCTALHLAAAAGHVNCIEQFFRHAWVVRHVDIDARDNQGHTALQVAAAAGHNEALRLLIQFGSHTELLSELTTDEEVADVI